jgi:acyl carrier protein
MKKKLLDKIAEILEVDSVASQDELSSFEEWDSLTGLSIIAMVYGDYSKKLTNEQLKNFSTIGDLVTYVLD